MSGAQDGGAAFPVSIEGVQETPGMTLRDWFAGQIVAAIIGMGSEYDYSITEGGGTVAEKAARDAYRVADAMLAARAVAP